jgi:hypothetical protein
VLKFLGLSWVRLQWQDLILVVLYLFMYDLFNDIIKDFLPSTNRMNNKSERTWKEAVVA